MRFGGDATIGGNAETRCATATHRAAADEFDDSVWPWQQQADRPSLTHRPLTDAALRMQLRNFRKQTLSFELGNSLFPDTAVMHEPHTHVGGGVGVASAVTAEIRLLQTDC